MCPPALVAMMCVCVRLVDWSGVSELALALAFVASGWPSPFSKFMCTYLMITLSPHFYTHVIT